MQHGHPRFSSKLMVMLGKALFDLFQENNAEFRDLMEAYELPHLLEDNDLRPIELGPEDYVRELAKGDPGLLAVRLVEVIHEEVTTDSPAVFTETNKGERPGQRRDTRVPWSYIRLTRQLRSEGFTFRGGKIVPIDPDAPQEFKDKTELAARVRSHPELDPTTLIDHMDESDSTIGNGEWKSAAGAARHFFEGLFINISVCTAQIREGVPPRFPEKDQRPKFGRCRTDLRRDSFTTAKEDKLIEALYAFMSDEGGHYGITEEQMAKLTRRLCWILAAHLLTKYESQGGVAE